MSISSCTKCGRIVDTDVDCYFYSKIIESGEEIQTLGECYKCRGEA